MAPQLRLINPTAGPRRPQLHGYLQPIEMKRDQSTALTKTIRLRLTRYFICRYRLTHGQQGIQTWLLALPVFGFVGFAVNNQPGTYSQAYTDMYCPCLGSSQSLRHTLAKLYCNRSAQHKVHDAYFANPEASAPGYKLRQIE